MGNVLRGGLVALLVMVPGVASAGRTPFGWLLGTEVMPERGTEIQSWIDEENGREPTDVRWATWGWNALIGVTDRFTVGFPLEMVWSDTASAATAPVFTLHQYGLEARYRLVSNDPVDAPPFAPLLRAAVKRDITVRDAVVVEANLIASTTTSTGSVLVGVDVGFVGLLAPDDQTHLEIRPGLGISVRASGELRLGAEVYGELSLDDKEQSWLVAGPNLAWTHGRFWVSGAFGIGVYQIDAAPRVTWGIMF